MRLMHKLELLCTWLVAAQHCTLVEQAGFSKLFKRQLDTLRFLWMRSRRVSMAAKPSIMHDAGAYSS
jgi:hypothetical protein